MLRKYKHVYGKVYQMHFKRVPYKFFNIMSSDK